MATATSPSANSTTTAWRIDPATSRLEFTIGKRLMFVMKLKVTGRFSEVSGTIALDEQDPTNSRADVTIGAASLDTKQKMRDKHLRTADFFDMERYPNLTFKSQRIEAIDRATGRYRVIGDLTVRDVTKSVTLDAQYAPTKAGAADRRITLTISGALNRRDFGIVWNKPHINVEDGLQVNLTVQATPA